VTRPRPPHKNNGICLFGPNKGSLINDKCTKDKTFFDLSIKIDHLTGAKAVAV